MLPCVSAIRRPARRLRRSPRRSPKGALTPRQLREGLVRPRLLRGVYADPSLAARPRAPLPGGCPASCPSVLLLGGRSAAARLGGPAPTLHRSGQRRTCRRGTRVARAGGVRVHRRTSASEDVTPTTRRRLRHTSPTSDGMGVGGAGTDGDGGRRARRIGGRRMPGTLPQLQYAASREGVRPMGGPESPSRRSNSSTGGAGAHPRAGYGLPARWVGCRRPCRSTTSSMQGAWSGAGGSRLARGSD